MIDLEFGRQLHKRAQHERGALRSGRSGVREGVEENHEVLEHPGLGVERVERVGELEKLGDERELVGFGEKRKRGFDDAVEEAFAKRKVGSREVGEESEKNARFGRGELVGLEEVEEAAGEEAADVGTVGEEGETAAKGAGTGEIGGRRGEEEVADVENRPEKGGRRRGGGKGRSGEERKGIALKGIGDEGRGRRG